ncbi:helix-turn-helix domain-containing protein [uncultured Muribaculum sp.]|uniref:helix-turn-helix domain-containing protein n=2 Tax=uncultured Muribaculum sp. TaxID=1918613 RepID=UPI0026702C2D|nr:helix-turn-helix transcriptional regulator [uncultured Muribaculum sp.]
MATMKLYTHADMLDRVIGEKGTPQRDSMEAELQSYLIGEAIKLARKEKKLTQQQLGELMGVQRAQISRIEKGHNLTVSTIVKAFKAMGFCLIFFWGSFIITLLM